MRRSLILVLALLAVAPWAPAQVVFSGPPPVWLQASSPGTTQTGNATVSGVVTANGGLVSGVTTVGANALQIADNTKQCYDGATCNFYWQADGVAGYMTTNVDIYTGGNLNINSGHVLLNPTGPSDFGGGVNLGVGASLPATCAVNDLGSANASGILNVCTATNTWTPLPLGSSLGADAIVLQSSSPGTAQTGNENVSGAIIAGGLGTFDGGVAAVGSANTLTVAGSATTAATTITATGSDTNVGINLVVKGSGSVQLGSSNATVASTGLGTFVGLTVNGGSVSLGADQSTTASAYTILDNGGTVVISNGSTTTLTLPTSSAGRIFMISNQNASSATVKPGGAGTINGGATLTLAQFGAATVYTTGSDTWFTI